MKDYRISHTLERVVEKYEHIVYQPGSYDDMVWRWEQGVLDQEIRRLQMNVPAVEYLDFGCGTGRIAAYVESKVAHATGVDPAEAMVRIARERVRHTDLVVADITQNDVFSGHVFDLITAFRIFLNSQPQLREEMMNVLVPKLRNGHSVFIFNIHGNLWSHRLFSKIWYTLCGRRLNTMTLREATRFINKHNLTIVRWYGFGILPKVVYRVLGSLWAYKIDQFFSPIPGMRYISYDLVFVCKKSMVIK